MRRNRGNAARRITGLHLSTHDQSARRHAAVSVAALGCKPRSIQAGHRPFVDLCRFGDVRRAARATGMDAQRNVCFLALRQLPLLAQCAGSPFTFKAISA